MLKTSVWQLRVILSISLIGFKQVTVFLYLKDLVHIYKQLPRQFVAEVYMSICLIVLCKVIAMDNHLVNPLKFNLKRWVFFYSRNRLAKLYATPPYF